ncbi:hypothetical protein [Agathobacter rectalis]|uniref:Uncharacterized protein n=1 Tax=Agathobacter rectalis TaxID=39491 RepID=A0A3E4YLB2_9FIRM|nr:hypothetical protein [Agathobacter rectalis]RGM75528.1 hypothetical protein DXB99_03100 [Agathobacter rectalis]
MFEPQYFCNNSLVNNKYKLVGNIKLVKEIEQLTKEYIVKKISLYNAQDNIINYIINTYGKEWYENNGEAVNYIIENEYCNEERNKHPLFDKRKYEFDMKHSVLY